MCKCIYRVELTKTEKVSRTVMSNKLGYSLACYANFTITEGLWVLFCVYIYIYIYIYIYKGKAVPLQAWSGPDGSRKLRFPDFMTTAQDGGKVVSLTHRSPLPAGNTLVVLISVRG